MDGTKKKVKMFLLFCMTLLVVVAAARGKPAQAANYPAKEELFDYDDLKPKTENGSGTGKVKDFLSQNITIDSAGRRTKQPTSCG